MFAQLSSEQMEDIAPQVPPAAGRFLLDVVPLASGQSTEAEIASNFSRVVSETFGIEEVNLSEMKKYGSDSSPLLGYLLNTKKPYIDNQLSEYSAFPELIGYKNKGFKSCAVLPLVADGKVISVLELLSSKENKFNDSLVKDIGIGASLIGFVLMYKSELARSIRLATYFDAAFSSQYPQLIIADDGSIVKFNKSAIKQFGISAPEQRKIQDILKIDFSKILSLTNGVYANIIMGNRGASGRVYAITASRINDKLVHLAGNDITGQFAYASLSKSLSKSKELCILFADTGFTVVDITENAESMLGYSSGVLLNGNLVELAAKGEQNSFRESLVSAREAVPATGAVKFEFGNTRRYLRYIASPFLNGYMVMLFNADYERRAEDAKNDLHEFISNSSDIMLKTDSLGYIRDCNLPAQMILGFKKEELVGKGIKSIYVEQDILDRDINYVRNGGKVDNTLVNLVKKDGSYVPATHSVRTAKSGDSGAESDAQYLIVAKELATKRRLEEQELALHTLERQNSTSTRENALKSQFIYNISHELKTPLTNIKGYSKLLYDGQYGTLSAQQKEFIQTTLDEADRLLLIIQQVLDASKLEAEKVKLETKEVDFNMMKNNPSIDALRQAAEGKGLNLFWDVKFGVPKIPADPNRLIQVFVNLIGNAIKFTNKGNIAVRITKKSTKYIECRITDTGIGINDTDKKILFRRKFYEAAKKGLVQQPGAGTGLGLSIAKDIVKLHGGKIGVESKQGEGSTFWFTLPIQKPRRKERPQDRDRVQERQQDAPQPDAQPKAQ